MENINKLRKFYELKHVERSNSVKGRKESPAEHTWSSLILADYFMEIMKQKLDRLKVFELLLYHDVVEIETGDICISKEKERIGKEGREKQAAHILKEHIPAALGDKFLSRFEEFEGAQTTEAKFAKAIDAIDAQIHELDYKEDWKGWTEEFLRSKKGYLFEDFPELKEAFEAVMVFLEENGYFSQN
jgi:putative hydrolases of HD superfamily